MSRTIKNQLKRDKPRLLKTEGNKKPFPTKKTHFFSHINDDY